MSLRASTLALMLFFAACSGSEDSGDDLAAQDAGETVVFESPGSEPLLPNQTLDLTVRYLDERGEKQAGVLVDFALVGAATGASLTPARDFTDAEGYAKTTLRAGSTATDLEVRARAGERGYALLKISVRPALGTTLKVGVNYPGKREVSSYTVTSIPKMSCALALSSGLAGAISYTLRSPLETASFDFGYGIKAAIVGWGRDSAGSKLVRGCTDFESLVTDDAKQAQSQVTLAMSDIAMEVASPLSAELELNVSSTARRLAEAAQRAAASKVSPSGAYAMFADADYLLDQVQAKLSPELAAELTSRRSSQSLASSLQPALNAGSTGPTAFGEQLGDALAKRASSLVLRFTLSPSLQPTVSSFTALAADGSASLDLGVPQLVSTASFTPEDAQLVFSQLRIGFSLTLLGQNVLGAAAASDPLPAERGCRDAFASWWTKNALTDLASADAVTSYCELALAGLEAETLQQITSLASINDSVSLAGKVSAHDRDEDGKVDDLGPGSLNGAWGSDIVVAQLRAPKRTAFE